MSKSRNKEDSSGTAGWSLREWWLTAVTILSLTVSLLAFVWPYKPLSSERTELEKNVKNLTEQLQATKSRLEDTRLILAEKSARLRDAEAAVERVAMAAQRVAEMDSKLNTLEKERAEILVALESTKALLNDTQEKLAQLEKINAKYVLGGDFVRTPHMDATNLLRPGKEFLVRVYLDKHAPHVGENSGPVIVPFNESRESMRFSVWLYCSSHFQVAKSSIETITARRGDPSSSVAAFRVRVRDGIKDLTGAFLTANFSYRQRPTGYVTRRWNAEAGPIPGVSAEFVLDQQAQAPDLAIEVVTNDVGQLTCNVRTPHLKEFMNGNVSPWHLRERAEKLVNERMKGFVVGDRKERLRALRASGIEFYKASPENFKNVLWQLIKLGKLNSIYVTTDEPSFPWELLIPSPKGNPTDQRKPLGIEYSVGRWITDRSLSPPQTVGLTNSLVIARPFNDKELDRLADDEVSHVVGAVNGESKKPVSSDELESLLAASNADVLHFICHGKAIVEQGRQIIEFEKFILDSGKIAAMDGFLRFFKERRPLIFLNACDAGKLQSGLVGVAGFPEAFASLKAGAVVAPLWSVKHGAAHDVAVEFYRRVHDEPKTPLATIIRDIRAKTFIAAAAEGEDTFAAYCFYGDPLCIGDRQEAPRHDNLPFLPESGIPPIPGLPSIPGISLPEPPVIPR